MQRARPVQFQRDGDQGRSSARVEATTRETNRPFDGAHDAPWEAGLVASLSPDRRRGYNAVAYSVAA